MGAQRGESRELTKLEDRYAGYYDVLEERTGEKIGKVGAAFLDEGDQREYVAVRRGLAGLLPGTGSSLIPMDVVSLVDNERGSIEVLASKETVKDSPSVDTSRGLSAERAAEVRGYYRL